MMESELIVRGRAQADLDWEQCRAARQSLGDVYANIPIIDESGFYLRVCWEDAAYINAYNSRIRELLDTHGTPRWAPGKRVILPPDLPGVLASVQPYAECESRLGTERKLVRRHVRIWMSQFGVRPAFFLSLPDRETVILAGRVREKVLVDQLDVRADTWMARNEVDDSVFSRNG